MNFKLKQARLTHEPPYPAWRLALKIGISPQKFSDIELQKKEPTEEIKNKLSMILKTPIEELFPIDIQVNNVGKK